MTLVCVSSQRLTRGLDQSQIRGVGFAATCSLVVLDKNFQPVPVNQNGRWPPEWEGPPMGPSHRPLPWAPPMGPSHGPLPWAPSTENMKGLTIRCLFMR